ncbi:hypothetical protein FRC02_009058 [Tulasnella sp. 418]|nr:hypothetical protein FRC02_009058 [Tulasnella sp. 418]
MWTAARSASRGIKPYQSRVTSSPHLLLRMASTIDAYLTTATNTDSNAVPFNSQALWQSAKPKPEPKNGDAKLFYDVDQKGSLGVVVSLGKEQKESGLQKESVRKAVAKGVKKLKEAGAKGIAIDVAGIDAQAAVLLSFERHYKGASDKSAPPLVFVGKGITFDSGGISLKPSANMKLMRGDMGGAATVVSAALAIAKQKLPINLTVITPLAENLPGPSANKPGDVIVAMNGKTVEIDNTDAEGRLILSDAIYYATSTFKPTTVIDVATLTGAMVVALGTVYSGVFTNSDSLWKEIEAAGLDTYDRFWRMPLDEDYAPQISGSNADLCNTGGREAGSCTAALFLKSFVDGIDKDDATIRWAHIDIAGSMDTTRAGAYQEKGMTGRPVRSLIALAQKLASS